MAISLAQRYTNLVDKKFQKMSLTANLEVNSAMVKEFDGVGTIQIMDIVTSGMADYSRSAGYGADGVIDTNWVPYTIDNDRGKPFTVDAMDNAESLNTLFLVSMNQFMEQQVIPEVDSTRFASMAGKGTTPVLALLADGNAVLAAIDAAILAQDDESVPDENKVIYMSNAMYSLLKTATDIGKRLDVGNAGEKAIDRRIASIDGIGIVKVPPSRFNTSIILGTDGYTQDGTDINFQLVHTPSVSAITRHKEMKVILAAVNQSHDGDSFKYRIYHDIIIPTNSKPGVYTHAKPVV